jgi:hypothetical protein
MYIHVDYQVQLPWLEGGLWCLTQLSWQLVLLVKETGVPRKNHQPAASHWQTLSHNVVSSTPHLSGIRTHSINGDRHWLHGSYKSNMIATTTSPSLIRWCMWYLFITITLHLFIEHPDTDIFNIKSSFTKYLLFWGFFLEFKYRFYSYVSMIQKYNLKNKWIKSRDTNLEEQHTGSHPTLNSLIKEDKI